MRPKTDEGVLAHKRYLQLILAPNLRARLQQVLERSVGLWVAGYTSCSQLYK